MGNLKRAKVHPYCPGPEPSFLIACTPKFRNSPASLALGFQTINLSPSMLQPTSFQNNICIRIYIYIYIYTYTHTHTCVPKCSARLWWGTCHATGKVHSCGPTRFTRFPSVLFSKGRYQRFVDISACCRYPSLECSRSILSICSWGHALKSLPTCRGFRQLEHLEA